MLWKKLKSKKDKIMPWVTGGLFGYILIFYATAHYRYVEQNRRLENGIMSAMNHMVHRPFELTPFPKGVFSLSFLVLLGAFVALFFIWQSVKLKSHDDLDTVAGDAKWMTEHQLEIYKDQFIDPDFGKNFISSQDIMLSTNTRKTNFNLNQLYIGGSGSGKSFRVIGPNIMQRNCSFIITDPSGNLYAQYAPFLEYYGYRIKCFNLDRMESSNHYNPFRYIHSDKDIEILVTMLMENTTDPGENGGDPFWKKSEQALLTAIIAYLYHYGNKENQTFAQVLALVRSANIDENNSSMQSRLDMLFEEVEEESFTKAQYENFRLAAGKTLKSILISTAVRLQAFDLSNVQNLTNTDDIHLDAIPDEKTALFIIIPTGESTFNYIAGLMYSQLFRCMYRYCENEAQYSQIILDRHGDAVKVFRAETAEEAEKVHQTAEEYFKTLVNGSVVESSVLYSEDSSKNRHPYYEIRTSDGELFAYRGTKELAEEALQDVKKGHVASKAELAKRGNEGRRCPIHVRFLLDEFANTGKIPDFTQIISTIRKYEISTTIILQALTQIQNLYEKDWETISGNCDTFAYLGGGLDKGTTEWLSTLLSKKTVKSANESFAERGGSMSIQHSGVELASMSLLRTMDTMDCIVIPKGQNAYKGPKYDTLHHPEWKLVCSLNAYQFDQKKIDYLNEAFHVEDPFKPKSEQETIPPEAPDDKAVREEKNETAKQQSKEITANVDSHGEPVVSEPVVLSPEPAKTPDKILNEIMDTTSLGDVLFDGDAMCFSPSGDLDDEDMDFSSAPMDM